MVKETRHGPRGGLTCPSLAEELLGFLFLFVLFFYFFFNTFPCCAHL